MVNSFCFGRLASISAALPLVAIFSGGKNLVVSPGCQFRLPPGPAVARGTDFSHLPPVRPALALAVPIDRPQAEKTIPAAPADPMILQSVRRSILPVSSGIGSTLLSTANLYQAPRGIVNTHTHIQG